MTEPGSSSLVLGAASKLGYALSSHLLETTSNDHTIIAADVTANRIALEKWRASQGTERIVCAEYSTDAPFLGFSSLLQDRIKSRVTRVFNVAHLWDRRQKDVFIKRHNTDLCRRVIAAARTMERLESVVVFTDVGLVGDYPGKFSEGWLDVGQTLLDEVDRTSLEVERTYTAEAELPVVRARIGLLSDSASLLESERTAAETLVPFVKIIKKMPRFLSVPVFVRNDSLAPLTPTGWAARSASNLAADPRSLGRSVHLIVAPSPETIDVLAKVCELAGGARIKRGLLSSYTKVAEIMPGLSETTKRQADQVASLWTPHRYCLSRNDLDTSGLLELLSDKGRLPSWGTRFGTEFFRHIK